MRIDSNQSSIVFDNSCINSALHLRTLMDKVVIGHIDHFTFVYGDPTPAIFSFQNAIPRVMHFDTTHERRGKSILNPLFYFAPLHSGLSPVQGVTCCTFARMKETRTRAVYSLTPSKATFSSATPMTPPSCLPSVAARLA